MSVDEPDMFSTLDALHKELPATQLALAHLFAIAVQRCDFPAAQALLDSLGFVFNELYGERA